MFDFVRDNTRLMLGLLVLLIVPSFVFFGIEGYKGFNGPENAEVAVVAGQKVTQGEWDAAHRQQSENIRRQFPTVDAALLDRPEAKYDALEQLVRQRVLATLVRDQRLVVTDARLQREILASPQLAALRRPDGTIDLDRYRSLLAAQGLTPEGFEANVRQDLALNQVLGSVTETTVVPAAVQELALKAIFQQRTLRMERFQAQEFAARVAPTDDELKAHYDAKAELYRTPEQADIEYVVLDAAALRATLAVSDEELRKYYDENLAAYTRAEERRASHILLKVDAKASADEKAKVRARAEQLLAEVRKAPARFAELAKAQSDDPGSASAGGDLDFITRGAMVKPFEDAVFAMKPGEINGPIETEFGWHIIQLTAVRGGERQPFDKVRPEIEEKLRQQLGQRRYAESAEAFSNLVYEQSDSLKGAAERFKLTVRTATVGRKPTQGAQGPLASDKLLAAVFSDEALKNKRNTDAVETGPSQMVSARVVGYRPASVQPFESVRTQVLEKVRQEQAQARAVEAGKTRLEAVKAAPALLDKGLGMTVSRAAALGLPRDLMDAVLRADATKLPAVIGVDAGVNGYAVVRIDAVKDVDVTDALRTQWAPRLNQAWGTAEGLLVYKAHQERLKVRIKPSKPSPKAEDSAAAAG